MGEELICWWCVHKLPDTPTIHLPVKFVPKENVFRTIGNFCSWECAKAYSLNSSSTRTYEMQSLLSFMRLRALGRYIPLYAAPKQSFLKCFGGHMDIEEFRTTHGKVAPTVEYRQQVHLHPVPVIEDNPKPDLHQNAKKMYEIDQATASGPVMKLKRAKPLERSKSKLESALGIRRKTSLGTH